MRHAIEEQKRDRALVLKVERGRNMESIAHEKECSHEANAKKREMVTLQEVLIQESVQAALNRRAEEIRAAQDREYHEVARKLREKQEGLARVQARWKERAEGSVKALSYKSSSLILGEGFSPRNDVAIHRGRLSCKNIVRTKQAFSTLEDPGADLTNL